MTVHVVPAASGWQYIEFYWFGGEKPPGAESWTSTAVPIIAWRFNADDKAHYNADDDFVSQADPVIPMFLKGQLGGQFWRGGAYVGPDGRVFDKEVGGECENIQEWLIEKVGHELRMLEKLDG